MRGANANATTERVEVLEGIERLVGSRTPWSDPLRIREWVRDQAAISSPALPKLRDRGKRCVNSLVTSRYSNSSPKRHRRMWSNSFNTLD